MILAVAGSPQPPGAYVVRDCITACVGQQLLVFDASDGSAVAQIELAVGSQGQPSAVPASK